MLIQRTPIEIGSVRRPRGLFQNVEQIFAAACMRKFQVVLSPSGCGCVKCHDHFATFPCPLSSGTESSDKIY